MINTANYRKYLSPKKIFSNLRNFSLTTVLVLVAVFLVQQSFFKVGVNASAITPTPTPISTETLVVNAGTVIINGGNIITTGNLQSSVTPQVSPTRIPTPTPNQPIPTTTIQPKATYPSQLINLTNWKITLPIGSSGKPTEIKQTELGSYKIDPWFLVNPQGDGVRFRAPVNGMTTSGSSYPRSELREMSNNGTTNASWSSTSGTHTMFLDAAVTAVPQTKKHVVAGQIHDSSDDVIVIRLEYPNLYVNVDGKNAYTLDSNYTLGKRFTVKFVASGGKTKVYYNGKPDPSYTLSKEYSGAYFKAGAYTQSNCSKESSSGCNSNNFGEVIIYQALVTH